MLSFAGQEKKSGCFLSKRQVRAMLSFRKWRKALQRRLRWPCKCFRYNDLEKLLSHAHQQLHVPWEEVLQDPGWHGSLVNSGIFNWNPVRNNRWQWPTKGGFTYPCCSVRGSRLGSSGRGEWVGCKPSLPSGQPWLGVSLGLGQVIGFSCVAQHLHFSWLHPGPEKEAVLVKEWAAAGGRCCHT